MAEILMKQTAADLTDRLLRGEHSAFDDIVVWYSDDVLRLCVLLLADEDEAKDVLQEALLRLVRLARLGKFRQTNGSIKGFLMTAARNLCIDRLNERRKRETVADSEPWLETLADGDNLPDVAADEQRFDAVLKLALERLNARQRAILLLREFNGESFQAIGQALDLSSDGVKQQFYRTLKKLRVWLKDYQGES